MLCNSLGPVAITLSLSVALFFLILMIVVCNIRYKYSDRILQRETISEDLQALYEKTMQEKELRLIHEKETPQKLLPSSTTEEETKKKNELEAQF